MLTSACNFIKKETLTQVFSCEFCEISKSTFVTEHLWWLLLTTIRIRIENTEISYECPTKTARSNVAKRETDHGESSKNFKVYSYNLSIMFWHYNFELWAIVFNGSFSIFLTADTDAYMRNFEQIENNDRHVIPFSFL